MISSIEIQGFRGIKEGKLDELTPLVVLVGPNGCGKSAVLDALLIGASPVPANAVKLIAEQRLKIVGRARWLLYKADILLQSKIHIVTVDRFAHTVGILISYNIPDCSHFEFDMFEEDSTGFASSYTFGTISDQGMSCDFNYVNALGDVPDVRFVDLSQQLHQTPLHQLFSQAVQQGRRAVVNEILRAIVPNVTHMEILTEGDAPVIHLVYDDYSVPAALAGDGIYALLRLCLELASRPNGVVLLEEPEVHQHPGAIRQSARAILAAIRRGIQVVLTTHSLDLIDFLLSETQSEEELNKISIRRLQLKDGCLKSSNLSGSESAFARAEIEDDLR